MTPWAVLAFTIVTAGAGPAVFDETYDLDIAERVIEQQAFEAGHELRIDERGFRMDAGVRLFAGSIHVLLRNVKGRVRFRADFGPLDTVLRGRAAARAAVPPEGVQP